MNWEVRTMQSKTSFFNKTLFRKNLTRFWPLWGMASLLGALFPLAMLLELIRNPSRSMTPLNFTEGYYAVLTIVPVISLLYAILCAMVVWSYLYNARSVGLMHTLPIRREGVFVTNFLSGMAMMIIPYAVTGALCVLISAFYGGIDPAGLFNTILGVLGLSFFYFASATFTAFVTGNIFALPALYFLFHFLAVLLEWLLTEFASCFLVGVNSYYTGAVSYLSPTVHLMGNLGVDTTYTSSVPAYSSVYAPAELTAVELENFWLIGVYALVGAVLLALAWLLYRRRRSECAGDVVAVGWMKPVFRYGVAALAALLGGRLLYALFWEGPFQQGSYCDALPMLVCMIVAGVIGYYGASMLLAKSLRVFRRSWLGVLLVAAGCAAVCAGLRFDLAGIERRVPEAGELQRVHLYTASNNYDLSSGQDDALIEEVLGLHRAITASADELRNLDQRLEEARSRDEAYTYVWLDLNYTLASGRTLERSYSIPITQSRIGQAGTLDCLLDQLVNSEAMKAKRLHLDDPSYTVAGGGIYQYTRDNSTEYLGLSSREAAAVLEAIGKDAAAGAWGQVDWFDENHDGAYALDFSLNFTQELPDGAGTNWDTISITVRPEMTSTLACLEELGLIDRERLLTWSQYDNAIYGPGYDGAVSEGRIPANTEYVYEDPFAEENYVSPAASIGVIGGEDGPTEVFVAGAVG